MILKEKIIDYYERLTEIADNLEDDYIYGACIQLGSLMRDMEVFLESDEEDEDEDNEEESELQMNAKTFMEKLFSKIKEDVS